MEVQTFKLNMGNVVERKENPGISLSVFLHPLIASSIPGDVAITTMISIVSFFTTLKAQNFTKVASRGTGHSTI